MGLLLSGCSLQLLRCHPRPSPAPRAISRAGEASPAGTMTRSPIPAPPRGDGCVGTVGRASGPTPCEGHRGMPAAGLGAAKLRCLGTRSPSHSLSPVGMGDSRTGDMEKCQSLSTTHLAPRTGLGRSCCPGATWAHRDQFWSPNQGVSGEQRCCSPTPSLVPPLHTPQLPVPRWGRPQAVP